MHLTLAYGTTGLPLELDEALYDATVLMPKDLPAHPDPKAAFAAAVERPYGSKPLAELAAAKRPRRVAIAIADHTRPVPDRLLVPWIVERLGVRDDQVTILIGTGTHRGSTPEELTRMLGDAAGRFRIVNHDCERDDELVLVGRSACGGECWLNRYWVEADFRIATGFIEPHFFAGFSGGSKGVVPAIAGFTTVQHFHRASLIAHPGSTWGDPRANPLQALTREMTALCPPDFIVNVTLNLAKAITAVYAGETRAAHDAGCAAALHEAMIPVPRRFPVVITTNSGYPLDQNMYQTVKGISAAARIVEDGGTIICASRCNAGMPAEGQFRALLADPRPSDQLLAAILASERTPHDQWQVQTLLQCAQRARIVLCSELSEADRAVSRTIFAASPGEALAAERARRGGGRLAVAVMPMGPLTIPSLTAAARS